MRFKVQMKQPDYDKRIKGIKTASTTGTRKVAERYRDELKKNFQEASYHTDYPGLMGSSKSITHGLVVSDKGQPDYFTVGPKKGSMKTSGSESGNMLSYETIFKYLEEGTGARDYWTFKLTPNREHLSPNGYWTTKGLEPKRFMEKTYDEYSNKLLRRDAKELVEPEIRRELRKK